MGTAITLESREGHSKSESSLFASSVSYRSLSWYVILDRFLGGQIVIHLTLMVDLPVREEKNNIPPSYLMQNICFQEI